MSARKVISLLQVSAEANRKCPLRDAQLLHLPATGELIVSGDLHNHVRNFQRLRQYAALDKFPLRHVILQEIIHGGPLGPQGQDTSFGLFLDALNWAREFPNRVHFLLANHDLAQVQKLTVLKDGYDLTERFDRHLKHLFAAEAPAVDAAFRDLVYSQVLAAVSVSGLFLSHSLPVARDLPTFDPALLRRNLTGPDYLRNGSVYKLLWGRRQTADALTQLARLWWADVFVCGHQTQDEGFAVIQPNLFIVDSSHNHGAFLHLDLSRPYTLDDLTTLVRPLASLP